LSAWNLTKAKSLGFATKEPIAPVAKEVNIFYQNPSLRL
jgi:hypothetical protein